MKKNVIAFCCSIHVKPPRFLYVVLPALLMSKLRVWVEGAVKAQKKKPSVLLGFALQDGREPYKMKSLEMIGNNKKMNTSKL